MQPDRRGPADALPEGRARRVGELVAPRPEPVVAAAGGRLPLDLGRQPHAVRGAERLRLVARDVRQRHAVVAGDGCAADPEALDRTTRRGVSSSSGGYAAAGSIPIGNGPAGIATQSITQG